MTFKTIIFILLLLVAAFIVYHVITKKKALAKNQETWIMRLNKKDSTKSVASSLIAILLGLLVGVLFLAIFSGVTINNKQITKWDFIDAFELIFLGGFFDGRNESGTIVFGWNGQYLGNTLFKAMPLMLTGLSVAVAYKTGLFNIGAPGQYLVGTAASLIVALTIPTTVVPAFVVWILAFLAAIIAGALWATIAGALKAFLNVNEVITCIMTNWIAASLVTSLFDKETGPFNFLLDSSPDKNYKFVYKTTHNGVETFKLGLDKIFQDSQINGGIIIAIIIAILVYIIMNKTTFGYSLKACGSNKNAAKYAGINSKLYIILAMTISGALAGAGAALYVLSGNTEFDWNTYQSLPSVGFNGIPVAILASCNPIGVIFSSTFMAYLDVAGLAIRNQTNYNEYIASIISALIVYFSAFALIFKQMLSGKYHLKEKLIKLFNIIKDFSIKIFNKIFKKNKKIEEDSEIDKIKEETK